MKTDDGMAGPRINDKIRVREVRLIDSKGEQVGVVPTFKAMSMAQEEGLDLVEVAASSRPPVCKIMDFGKYKYEQKKKQQPTHHTKLKTIRLRPKTDPHILGIRIQQIREFLADGNRVLVEVRFRGREMAHQDIGRDMCNQVLKSLEDIAKCESSPRTENKNMSMTLSKK